MESTYRYRIFPDPEQKERIDATIMCCCFMEEELLKSINRKISGLYPFDIKEFEKGGKAHKENLEAFSSVREMKSYKRRKLNEKWLRDYYNYMIKPFLFDGWPEDYLDLRGVRYTFSCISKRLYEFLNVNRPLPSPRVKEFYVTTTEKGVKETIFEADTEPGGIYLNNIGFVYSNIYKVPTEEKIKRIKIQSEGKKYYAYVFCEKQALSFDEKISKTLLREVGIDLGIKNLIITSDKKIYENPHINKKYEERLSKLRSELKRKIPGSSNYKKTEEKINKILLKRRRAKRDYYNKIAHEIVSNYDIIYLETLDTKGMIGKAPPGLKSMLKEASLENLSAIIERQALTNGKQVIRVPPDYASSQICSNCGFKNLKIRNNLKIREWTCPLCGEHHDRDVNAAINILHKGQEIRRENK